MKRILFIIDREDSCYSEAFYVIDDSFTIDKENVTKIWYEGDFYRYLRKIDEFENISGTFHKILI